MPRVKVLTRMGQCQSRAADTRAYLLERIQICIGDIDIVLLLATERSAHCVNDGEACFLAIEDLFDIINDLLHQLVLLGDRHTIGDMKALHSGVVIRLSRARSPGEGQMLGVDLSGTPGGHTGTPSGTPYRSKTSMISTRSHRHTGHTIFDTLWRRETLRESTHAM